MFAEFTDKNNVIAVVGVSENQQKYGARIFRTLKKLGYNVYAVNPKHKELYGQPVYPRLSKLPVKPKLVITVVPPQVTLRVLEEVKKQAIEMVWMQEGSENDETINFCEENKLKYTAGACFIRDGLQTQFLF